MSFEPNGYIAIDRDPSYAPCCYVLCQCTGDPGLMDWDTRDEEHTILVQTDWDYPGIARSFGWEGDDRDIEGAADYLDDCVTWGKTVEDPGYFSGE